MDSLMLDDFFILIRSALWGTPMHDFKPLSEQEWSQLIALAKKQTVVGLIAEAASHLPKEVAPSQQVMTYLLKYSTRLMMTHNMLNSGVARVADFYRSHGVEGVLLKGQGVASSYPNPLLRACGDIDFYVGKDNYRKCVELAKEHLEVAETESEESIKHYHFNMDGVHVELHRIAAQMITPVRSGKFQRWLVSELEDSSRLRSLDLNGTEVHLPSADFDAFFIFYHAWWHLIEEGIGLRHLCDWAMTLRAHKDSINRKRLEELLRKFKYLKVWQIMGAIVVEQLGLPAEMMPLYNPEISGKYPWVMEKVMSGGNFGVDTVLRDPDRKRMSFVQRKTVALRFHMREYCKTFPIIPMESACLMIRFLTKSSVKAIKEVIKGE